jgi:peptidoglycan/LPS O-acetylase OafA/YrhL
MTEPTASPARGKRFAGLDGFRGFFLMFVVVGHLGIHEVYGAWILLSGFFVISGYLITSILLREHDRTGSISAVGFYRRRARRLLPALFLLVTVVGMWAVFAASDETRRQMKGDMFASLGFVMNWRLIAEHDQYFALFGDVSYFRHVWTLAVEEQFYILSPLVVLLVLAIRATWARFALITVGIVASTWIAASIGVGSLDAQARVYYGTDTRVAAVLVGVGLAFVIRRGIRWSRGIVETLGIVSLLGSVVLVFAVQPMSAIMFERGGLLGFSLLYAAGIVALVDPRGTRVATWMQWPPLVWLGIRIYGIYLWHWPVSLWLKDALDLPRFAHVVVGVALTLAIAAVSYRVIEAPVITGGLAALRWPISPRAIALGATVIVVGIPVAVGAVADAPAPPTTTPQLIEGSPQYEAKGPNIAVSLFGDSVPYYLAQDFPAEKYSDVKLTDLSIPGCSLVDVTIAWTPTNTFAPEKPCRKRFDDMSTLVKGADTFVYLGGSTLAAQHVLDNGTFLDVDDKKFRNLITTALDNLLASVRAGGVESFMIATVPCRDPQVRNFDMEDDQIASWVASNPEVIARFADPTTTNKIFTSWAHQNDVPVLDLYAALGCGSGYHTQIHGIPVFRDYFHFSSEAARMVWTWLVPEVRSHL